MNGILITYRSALLSTPKIHTDLLWYLTFFFCGLGIVYFVFVFFFRNRLSRKTSMVAEKKKELAPMISQFLFFDEGATLEEKKQYLSQKVEIREMIKTRFNRSVLSEILLDLQKDVSGEARQNLYDLYQGLGLHQDAFDKLKSWRWEIISQGILELTQMRVEESYMFIRKFINHRRGVIRKQAQIATVTLKHEGISYFLDTCRYRISEWQQLKLLDVLRHLEDFTPPRFKIWLTSKNNEVVLFALRLIRYYNQNDANQAIIQLIKHRNNQIKAEAVQCLKEFGVTEALESLKAAFRKCNTDVKISILDTIGTLGTQQDIEFLRKIEGSHENFTVKSKALSAINMIDPENIMPSNDIQEPSEADILFAQDDPQVQDQYSKDEVYQTDLIEQEGEEPLPIKELQEENENIFDLCFKEELDDILAEARQEEEPEYLSLNFLPVVEENIPKGPDQALEVQHYPADEIQPVLEEKFKQDLTAILNKIAMKSDKNRPKAIEEVPEFLPIVVENQEGPSGENQFDEIENLEVIAETVAAESNQAEEEVLDPIREPESRLSDIRDTPVIAETIPWQDLVDHDQYLMTIERKAESETDDSLEDDLIGFSIFREMFRDFDTESKLILLDEILVVGEEKELSFLATLSTDPDKRVRKKASKIKELLAKKLGATSKDENNSTAETNKVGALVEDEHIENQIEDLLSKDSEVEEKDKLPLELCFFQGNMDELMASEELEPQFDLDLDEEDSSIQNPDLASKDEDESDVRKASLLNNLFPFGSKSRDGEND